MSQTINTTEPVASTTDRLAAMAHETIDRVTPRANRAELDMRNTATRTAEGVKHLEEQALETAGKSLKNLHSFIEQNPLTTAGIAFAAGALLSVLIRR